MKRSQITEFGWLYGAKIAALIANVVVYRLASTKLGVDGFAEYSLARRAISFIMPALLLGQLVALPRQLAMTLYDEKRIQSLFLTSLLAVTLAFVVFCSLIAVFPGTISRLCFGDTKYEELLWPMLLFMVAQSLFFLVSGYHQGRMSFRMVGVIGVICGGALPVVGFLIAPEHAADVLLVSGYLILAVASGYTITAFVRHGFPRQRLPFGDLLEYGVPRVPGDFAMGGMLGLPSMIVASRVGLIEGGWIAFAGTMMSMVITAVAPFSTAWLPRFTRHLADGHGTELIRQIRRLVFGVTLVVAGGVVVVILAMPWLVSWYLGADYVAAVPILRLFAVGAIPFTVYGLLRSVVDAAYKKPINAINISISLGFFFLVEMMIGNWFETLWSVVIAAVASYLLMAVLCVIASWRALRPDFEFKA